MASWQLEWRTLIIVKVGVVLFAVIRRAGVADSRADLQKDSPAGPSVHAPGTARSMYADAIKWNWSKHSTSSLPSAREACCRKNRLPVSRRNLSLSCCNL